MLGLFIALSASALSPATSAPTVFAPGIVSGGAHDSAPAFAPDGKSVYFTRSSPEASFILISHRTPSGWSDPRIAPFSGRWIDMEPAISPDGSYLIFVSNRPANPGSAPLDGMIDGKPQPGKGANLWRVKRTPTGWGAPERLPNTINSSSSIYAPSIAANGSLYFMHPDSSNGRFRLFMSAMKDGAYQPPVALPFSTGESTDVDPAILPDESAIVFGSSRHAKKDIDLFVAYRRDGGSWSDPVYLGDVINSPTSDAEPRWGPDHHTLYFSSERLAPEPRPIPRGEAQKVLTAMNAWNNGLYNIWMVDLAQRLK